VASVLKLAAPDGARYGGSTERKVGQIAGVEVLIRDALPSIPFRRYVAGASW
jgi:hypothetical protein